MASVLVDLSLFSRRTIKHNGKQSLLMEHNGTQIDGLKDVSNSRVLEVEAISRDEEG